MPIYAYRCESCGHAQDVLQKLSDPVLTVCPACGDAAFRKQVTAAGFQLKGSGWYATDFRSGGKPEAAKKDTAGDGPADGAGSAAAEPAGAAKAAEAAAPAPRQDGAAPAAGGTPPAT